MLEMNFRMIKHLLNRLTINCSEDRSKAVVSIGKRLKRALKRGYVYFGTYACCERDIIGCAFRRELIQKPYSPLHVREGILDNAFFGRGEGYGRSQLLSH